MTMTFQIIINYSLWTAQKGQWPYSVCMKRLMSRGIMNNYCNMDWITEESRVYQGTMKIFCSLSRWAKPVL